MPDYKILFKSLTQSWLDLIKKVEATENEVRIRINSPSKYDSDSFRYITIDESQGIRAVVGCPKGHYKNGKCNVGTEVQAYRFDKDKWNKERASKWVKEHKD